MKRPSAVVWQDFRDRVTKLGGRVVEPTWLGINTPHRVICKIGHEVTPTPARLERGGGLCRACAGKDPNTAWRAFQQRIAELGGQVIESEWLGCQTPHRVICKAGHETTPRPNDVQQGGGGCRTCAGNDSATTERAFRKRVAELGGRVVEPGWLGSKEPHRIICVQGHEGRPRPNDVLTGHGLCVTCAGKDPTVSERAFHEGIVRLGGQVTEPAWLGARQIHRIICGNGHATTAHPVTVARGGEICPFCAGRAPGQAWDAFLNRVAELGGQVIEPEWLGNAIGHRVICREGHACTPRPADIGQGQGLCRFCAGKSWDAFYVVTNDSLGRVKFGITSGDVRRRLGDHRRNGYGTTIRAVSGIEDAAKLESSILTALRLAGIVPVQGREYFDIAVLPDILSVADGWSTRG